MRSSTLIVLSAELPDNIKTVDRDVIAHNLKTAAMAAATVVKIMQPAKLLIEENRSMTIYVPTDEVIARVIRNAVKKD